MAGFVEIGIKAVRHAAGFGKMKRLRTHVGVGVRGHVMRAMVWCLGYDVSVKHFGTNLHAT